MINKKWPLKRTFDKSLHSDNSFIQSVNIIIMYKDITNSKDKQNTHNLMYDGASASNDATL